MRQTTPFADRETGASGPAVWSVSGRGGPPRRARSPGHGSQRRRNHRPGSPDAAKEVATLIRQYAAQAAPIRAVMLSRLGPNVWHNTPAAAMATLEELEETARLMLLSPHTTPLNASALDDLRQTFGARW